MQDLKHNTKGDNETESSYLNATSKSCLQLAGQQLGLILALLAQQVTSRAGPAG